jgi:hypothetical protein
MARNISENSTYLEKILRHIFLGSVLQYMWSNDLSILEIYFGEVDNSGFDVILSTDKVSRYIQLKATNIHASRREVDIHVRLAKKVGGCIVWLFYDPFTLEIEKYLFFGGDVGQPLHSLSKFKNGHHTRKNADGARPIRKNIKLIPKKSFEHIPDIASLVKKLFDE